MSKTKSTKPQLSKLASSLVLYNLDPTTYKKIELNEGEFVLYIMRPSSSVLMKLETFINHNKVVNVAKGGVKGEITSVGNLKVIASIALDMVVDEEGNKVFPEEWSGEDLMDNLDLGLFVELAEHVGAYVNDLQMTAKKKEGKSKQTKK